MISLSRPSETLDYEILINDATFLSENALDVESSSEASLDMPSIRIALEVRFVRLRRDLGHDIRRCLRNQHSSNRHSECFRNLPPRLTSVPACSNFIAG